MISFISWTYKKDPTYLLLSILDVPDTARGPRKLSDRIKDACSPGLILQQGTHTMNGEVSELLFCMVMYALVK